MFAIGMFPPAPDPVLSPLGHPYPTGCTMNYRSTRPQPVRAADFPEVPLPEFEVAAAKKAKTKR